MTLNGQIAFLKVIIVLLSVVVLVGVWIVVTGLRPLASRRSKKTVGQYIAANTPKAATTVNSMDDAMFALSKRFVPIVRVDKIERSEMEKALRLAKMSYSPEEYKAYMLVVTFIFAGIGLFIGLLGVLFNITIFIIVGIGVAVIGVLSYFLNRKKLKTRQKEVVRGIDKELPRFVSYMNLNLQKSDESVLSMLERYISMEEAFGAELTTTIADAKTSSFDAALARWDQRVGSEALRKVIHGLVNANNGDDVTMYFALLERELTALEISYLKENVENIPRKMMLPKMMMYGAMAITLFFPIAVQIVDAFKEVFMS